ncbi:MAG: DUF1735 domain-containing protein [Chitinophagaceae bacterium]
MLYSTPFPLKLKSILFITALLLLMVSCKKSKQKNVSAGIVSEISDVRTDGNTKTVALSPTAGSETITAITLKNQTTGTGSSVHVKLSLDNAAVTAASLMPLPMNGYTLSTLEYDIPANGSVAVPIVINRTNLLTVDTTYGISFEISTTSSGTIANDAKKIMVKIGLRNRWDGRYKATGTMTDFSEPTIYSFPEQEIYVITTSPTQVKVIPKQLGIVGYIVTNIANPTFYGSFGPVVNFDATTNKITSVINFYGQPAANTRSAELDPSGTNQWDPTTKNIAIKFWMNQPSVITPHKAIFNSTWTYLGPR